MFEVFFNCFNLRFSAAEKLSLFTTFDRDGSGTVSYDEFIRGVRGDMNDFRQEWVNKAFSILDRDGSGVVTAAEMSKTYDVSKNPAVQSGKVPGPAEVCFPCVAVSLSLEQEISRDVSLEQCDALRLMIQVSPQQAILQFMKHFDQNSDGRITREDTGINFTRESYSSVVTMRFWSEDLLQA